MSRTQPNISFFEVTNPFTSVHLGIMPRYEHRFVDGPEFGLRYPHAGLWCPGHWLKWMGPDSCFSSTRIER